jgi:hypothetical protein
VRPQFGVATGPARKTAIRERWTASERYWANPDGTYTLERGRNINYLSATGWSPIDLTLVEKLQADTMSGALQIHGPNVSYLSASNGYLLPDINDGSAGYAKSHVTPIYEAGVAFRGLPGGDWAAGYETKSVTIQSGLQSTIFTSVAVHETATPVVLALAAPVLVEVFGIAAAEAGGLIARATQAGAGQRIPIPAPQAMPAGL